MKKHQFFVNIYVLMIFILLLSNCRINKDCICPEFYAPVCSENGIEYSNYCFADCDKVKYSEGACPKRRNAMIIVGENNTEPCHVKILIDGTYYLPSQPLSATFLQDSLWVSLKYRQLLDIYECSFNLYLEKVEVLEIKTLN